MHSHATQQLDVEVPHVELAPAGLTDQREGLDQESIKRLTATSSIAER